MKYSSRPLIETDLSSASKLDHKWFGEYGISEAQLHEYINQHPSESLAILLDNEFTGFATFETLNEGDLPTDYVGKIPKTRKVLFIQQFTTTTNYSKDDMSMDIELLKAVEQKAKELNCDEVWEALAITHPYSENQNSEYDAFGFYEKNGYSYDRLNPIEWKPDTIITIPCYLFRKKLR
jgi:hypothetical protein